MTPLTARDVCVCQENRQLDQYSKAEPERGHLRAQPDDQKGLENRQKREEKKKVCLKQRDKKKKTQQDFTVQPCSSNTFLSIYH